MNWQDSNLLFQEIDEKSSIASHKYQENIQILVDKETQETIQLKKYQDPAKNVERQVLNSLLDKFANLITKDSPKELLENLLDKDCEVFLFSSTGGKVPSDYGVGYHGFIDLYQDRKILQRTVRQTYIDLEKTTAFQLCNCTVSYQSEGQEEEEFTFEMFTIKGNKIVKYRACFGQFPPGYNNDPFKLSRRDKVLLKVKEINYALAGKPDLNKIALYFNEETEYKFWSWDEQKCFTFHKDDLTERFKEIESKLKIDSIVPYEIYTEGGYVIGTYVYHLQDKFSQKNFVWLSTVIYGFDESINLVKISQQGELYPNGEVTIPFEVYSRERLNKKVIELFQNTGPHSDIIYQNAIDFECEVCKFSPYSITNNIGIIHGLNKITPSMMSMAKNLQMDFVKAMDIFVDHHDASYDVVILLTYSQGSFHEERTREPIKCTKFFSMLKFGYENGKISKVLQFLSELPESIPWPFDIEI